jgi:hypothetical protein
LNPGELKEEKPAMFRTLMFRTLILRPLALLLSVVCLALIAAITLSCGSSSSHFTQGCTGGPYNVVGDWTLNLASASGPGVINSAGLAVFFQTTTTVPAPGDTVVLPTITGACSFSGTGTAYGTQASGGGSISNPVSGNVNSATSISGTISGSGAFSIAPNSPLSGSVTALSGNGWLGVFEGATQLPLIWNISLTPTGNNSSMTFTGSGMMSGGATCLMNGTFNQEGGNVANLNVFDITINSPDVGCPIGGTLNGLGFESNSDYFNLNGNAVGTYFYAIPSSTAFVLEVFQQQVK